MDARILTSADTELARRLVAEDPVTNVFVGSRLMAGVLNPGMPGLIWGWPARAPQALLHIGANLVPVATDLAPLPAFVEAAGRRRTCQSIVGPSWLAMPLWQALSDRWGRAYSVVREVRRSQPVMATAGSPLVTPDPRVRPITHADFESYFAAAVAMYTEEVGVDPLAGGGRAGYRAHCQSLVHTGRAWGIVTDDGRVVFKADVGVSCGGVAQVQGVWLAPHLRGQGLAAPAMGSATRLILESHDVVSLYVNDFNTRAVKTYLRTGFTIAGEFATVLY